MSVVTSTLSSLILPNFNTLKVAAAPIVTRFGRVLNGIIAGVVGGVGACATISTYVGEEGNIDSEGMLTLGVV